MEAGLKTRTEFITAWLAAESVEVIVRVLIGIPVFVLSHLIIACLTYVGLNLSTTTQVCLIVVLSAVLFWVATSLFGRRDSSIWHRAAH